jgi:(E)-4-hydroxy-3-methylbut-2-enyl-diphosphate synthase
MDTGAVAERVEALLMERRGAAGRKPLTVAVMGCEVNGPGEARDAQLALVGTRTGAALYREGTLVFRGSVDEAAAKLVDEIQRQD